MKKNQEDETVLHVMVKSGGYALHPQWNYHSYQPISSLFSWIRFYKSCYQCQQPFRKLILFGSSSSSEVVQCLGCGIYAHRSCAFRRTTKIQKKHNLFCPVHYPMVQSILQTKTSSSKIDTSATTTTTTTTTLKSVYKDESSTAVCSLTISTNKEDSTKDTVSEKEAIITPLVQRDDSVQAQPQENQQHQQQQVQVTTIPNTVAVSSRITSTVESISHYCYSASKVTIGGASLTGSVVGSVAGLAVAGPAGALIGSKLGQAACVLTALYQGRNVILLGAGLVAVAGLTLSTQQQQQQQQQQLIKMNPSNYHLLTLDDDDEDDNTASKLVLVRPHVTIDHTSWDEVITRVTKSFRETSNSNAHKSGLHSTRDTDIFEATELDTEEKVLLLVSRSLNDKSSLPGYMYRCLLEEHTNRANQRLVSSWNDGNKSSTTTTNSDTLSPSTSTNVAESNYLNNLIASSGRETRQDAHAVILYVTNALLEVRPEIKASQRFVDTAKDSVEIIVLGELYSSIFDEISKEVSVQDKLLQCKMDDYESRPTTNTNFKVNFVSNAAIETLQSISKCRSALHKLEIFVTFLEHLSDMYDADGPTMNADSLLTLVCRHILLAKVKNLNAEVGFTEEFAKDEHLLRGKSGYALVTMQASLHILNEFTNLDCFFLEDESVNG